MLNDYVVRQIDHEDRDEGLRVVGQLECYLRAIRSKETARERYQWLYLDNPGGRAITFGAFCPQGHLVGLTSLFPRNVEIGGDTGNSVALGSIGGDAFVVPEHRRLGIATRLHALAMSSMENGAIEFMYGPPEPTNLRALERSGATVIGQVERYIRPMNLASVGLAKHQPAWLVRCATALLAPRTSRIHLEALGPKPDPRVDIAFQRFIESLAGSPFICPVSDSRYVAWRFARSPSGRQKAFLLTDGAKPVGLVVLEHFQERAGIVDLWCVQRLSNECVAAVLHHCRKSASVDYQLLRGSRRTAFELMSHGFVRRGTQKRFQVQVPIGSRFRANLLSGRWHYTRGDGDVDRVMGA